MRWLIRFLLHVLLVIILLSISSGYVSTAVFPWHYLNLLIIYSTLQILMRDHGGIVWGAFGIFYGVELYSATPFGLVLFSGTIATLITLWLYRSLITNRTPLAAAALAASMVLSYRFLYFVGLHILQIRAAEVITPFGQMVTAIFWELILTAFFAAMFYYLFTHIVASFRLTTLKH